MGLSILVLYICSQPLSDAGHDPWPYRGRSFGNSCPLVSAAVHFDRSAVANMHQRHSDRKWRQRDRMWRHAEMMSDAEMIGDCFLDPRGYGFADKIDKRYSNTSEQHFFC